MPSLICAPSCLYFLVLDKGGFKSLGLFSSLL